MKTYLNLTTINSQCQPGFIYDTTLQRCKFCPNKWSSCQAYKKFVFTFRSENQNDNPFIINSLDNLVLKFSLLNAKQELFYIMNEFAVENIDIVVEFPVDKYTLLFGESTYQTTLDLNLKNVIKSLSNISITFQPENYSETNHTFAEIYWVSPITFSGFTHFTMRNVRFLIVPYYLTESIVNDTISTSIENYPKQFPGI